MQLLLNSLSLAYLGKRKKKNTHFSKEHYKKNEKWSEGLTSAAKDIGGGANVLVDAANGVINGDGKFEELIAASQEIASSTAQVHKAR